ncbi:MAG TPA: hypothetical protein VM933_01580 [Acidimicrobiales bacterium]|nr:hypothetical protein [Acidimicrobiales bacterium]
MEALLGAHLPGLRIPRVFGGHLVGPDVRADLAFTIGLLGEAGVGSVAGRPVEDALEAVLRPVDGAATNTFFSYRVAETLLRFPSVLTRLRGSTAVLEACDSTAALPAMRDGSLPRNYAAVLLRCEAARARLGLPVDDTVLDELVERTVAMLGANPGGYLDDSHTGIGRYDIYSADVYLFTEPVAGRLGEVWSHGARAALDLVARVGATNGAGITWGRSIGALATCLTVELTGLAASLGEDADGAWAARGANAFEHVGGWFGADGLITAHQHRSTFGYRGPFRRLQMTLDCLGKLADTAVALQRAAPRPGAPGVAHPFPDRDELVRFEAGRPAAVWTYRSRDLAFVVPLVGSTVGDYLPAPRNPGLFEVPVDTDLPTAVPSVFFGGKRYTSGGVPESAEHPGAGELIVTYDGFPRSRQFEATGDTRGGRRSVRYRVEGRTLHADEELTFDALPDALAVQLSETSGRPLRVDFRCDVPHAVTTIDVGGLKEHRSFWSELPVAHQLDVDPAPVVRLGWSVTPKLRVLSTELRHHYTRAVFDPLVARGDVVEAQVSRRRPPGDSVDLRDWDLFHLHWPEWYLGSDVARHRAAVEQLQAAGVRIVWTQHNLVPHDKDPRLADVYAVWAAAADGVVHHSQYGRRRVEGRHHYRDDAVHTVIPHPSFGVVDRPPRRADDPIRLGVVGAPRAEKDVQGVLDAFAATRRSDLSLHVWSLRGDERVPDDPRIHAEAYATVDRAVYDARLAALDAVVLPFAEGDMITTGTVGDVVAAGLAALVSGWGYLVEALGTAGLPYGDDLTATLEALDRERLDAAAAAAASLRPSMAPTRVADLHLALFEAVGTTRL